MLRKKILYIQHTGANGGATMSLFYLLEYAKEDYDIVVYFITNGPAVDFYKKAGIRCIIDKKLSKLPHCTIQNQSLNPLRAKFYTDLLPYIRFYQKLIPSYFAMRQIITDENPDIVHLNSSVLIAEGLATKAIGKPLVWHMRDFLEYGNFKIRYSVFRKIISYCADVVIALCESELTRIKPIKSGLVIPNFVNFSKFDFRNTQLVALRNQLGLNEDACIIAMLGWNTPAKGALTLMKAFALIKDKYPKTVLVLFGEGERNPSNNRLKNLLRKIVGKKNLRLELQKIIDLNNLQDRVFFPGVIFNIANYIAEADIIAAPFTEPHFARPILEAGAMKKLVITSDIDGTREMVLGGKAGYVAKPNNIENWAENLSLALSSDNTNKIELMYLNTLKTYNADKNACTTLNIYKNLL